MKDIKIILPVILLLAACSKDNTEIKPDNAANAGSAVYSQGAKSSLPFSAALIAVGDGNATPTPCSGLVPFAAPDFHLNGTATHLGLINAQASRLHHVSCDVNVTTMLLTTNVTVDLVAANGDLVHCTGNDVVNVANLLTQTGTTGSITGTWNITGGTGRFTGATGSININGTVDFVTNSFSCQCAGTIFY